MYIVMSTYVGSLQDLVQLKLLLMKPNQTLQSKKKTQMLISMLDIYMKRDSVDLRQELDRFQESPSQPINPSILDEMKRLDGILSSIINGSTDSSQGSLESSQSSLESSQSSLESSQSSFRIVSEFFGIVSEFFGIGHRLRVLLMALLRVLWFFSEFF